MILLGVLAVFAHAQTAPDIARGMSSDAVIRAHGWPKGKSATDNREVWLYDHFQVILEDDHVVSVSPLPPPLPPPPASKLPSLIRPMPVTPPGRIINYSKQPPPPPRVRTDIPTKAVRTSPAVEIIPASEPPAPVGARAYLDRRAWPLAIWASGVIVIGVVIVLRKRRARIIQQRLAFAVGPALDAAPRAEQNPEPPPARKTWQDIVAEKIAKSTGLTPQTTPARQDDERPEQFFILSSALLERLEWKRLELLVALYFNATGVRADAAGIGPDGGVDVQLYRTGETRPYAYVQCKAWEKDVGVALIRELLGVMSASQIPEGVFVTTGDYSDDARAFAKANRISAITGRDLINRVNQLDLVTRSALLAKVTEGDYTTPTCPSCGVKLVLREAKNPFWGCPSYPRCTGKINVRKSRRS